MARSAEVMEQTEKELGESTVAAFGLVITPSGVLFLENESEKAFELPGGGLDPEEEPSECFKRELEEEASISLSELNEPKLLLRVISSKTGQFIDIYGTEALDFTPAPLIYSVDYSKEKSLQDKDHTGLRYYSKEELLEISKRPRTEPPTEERPKFAGGDFPLDMVLKHFYPDFRGVDTDLYEVKIRGRSAVESINDPKILAYQAAVNKYPQLEVIN